MNFHQVNSQPRHMRYIFFVDSTINYNDLVEIMKVNLGFWGGVYNPIVPVKDGLIADEYKEVIRHYDPDIIFYDATVNPQMIKDLALFNASEYRNLGEMPLKATMVGVSRVHLLSLLGNRHLIHANNLWRSESNLLDYYELNFGIRQHTYVGDNIAAPFQKVLPVAPENVRDIHTIMHAWNPVDYAGLAGLYPCTKVLRSFHHVQYEVSELVIAAGKDDTQDLLYWWNRRLYEAKKIFFVTKDELTELMTDGAFGQVLGLLCDGPLIKVVSFSLSQHEVEEIINTSLKHIMSGRIFRYTPVASFPYPVDDTYGATPYVEQDTSKTQTLVSGELSFPVIAPAFVKATVFATDTWAVDTQFHTVGEDGKTKELLLPKTANVSYFIGDKKGRVNHDRRITYYYGSNTPHKAATIELRQMPTFSAMLPQLITRPVINGQVVESGYSDLEMRDPGNRLLSFLRLFKNNFYNLHQYLSDKFWYDLLVEACNSRKLAGDAITFSELSKRCQYMMAKERIALGPRKETRRNYENLQLGLKPLVAELVSMKVLIAGYTFKCTHCGYKAWYSVEDVSISIQCSGCMEYFVLPVDPEMSYRVSTLVKRNFFSAPKQPDGNAAVIGALVRSALQGNDNFDFSGQLNLYINNNTAKPVTDLDIVVLENGRLGIGEAKNNSREFLEDKKKCLHQLHDVATKIRPDLIILCCVDDEKDSLNKAKAILENLFKPGNKMAPEIVAFQLSAPTHFNFKGGLYFRY